MKNRYILSPFFLEEPAPELESLMKSDWFFNKPSLADGDMQTRMAAIYQPLAESVSETIAKGERPVVIAGDCCTTIGVLSGLQLAGHNPRLIWFKARIVGNILRRAESSNDMWLKIIPFIILGLAVIIAVALSYGSRRWKSATKTMYTRLGAARLSNGPTTYYFEELSGLPASVQRYVRTVISRH